MLALDRRTPWIPAFAGMTGRMKSYLLRNTHHVLQRGGKQLDWDWIVVA